MSPLDHFAVLQHLPLETPILSALAVKSAQGIIAYEIISHLRCTKRCENLWRTGVRPCLAGASNGINADGGQWRRSTTAGSMNSRVATKEHM